MDNRIIKFQLDLVICLLDADTGKAVSEKNVRFQRNGKRIRLTDKGSGHHISIGEGRENGIFHIYVYGYEEKEVCIDYKQLDPDLPVREVYLIPKKPR